MSSSDRMECPNCRQSIKRPALPPGAKCLCPKCNQPFSIGDGVPVASVTAAASVTPAAAPAANQSQLTQPTTTSAASTSSEAVAAQPVPAKPPVKVAPPKPPKPAEFRVPCYLCGSLLYARLDQVGSTVKCHDCHAETEVKPPRPQDVQNAADVPTLDDADDFALSPTFERPKFEALEIPPAEEAAVGDEFASKPLPARPPLPLSPKTTSTSPSSPVKQVAGTFPAKPRTSPPPQEFNPKALADKISAGVGSLLQPAGGPTSSPPRVRKHAESYGDELWDAPADTDRPAFERGPFIVGIVEFLFYPGTMVRWLSLVALASVPIAVLEMTAAAIGPYGSVFSGAALTLLFFAAVLGIPWLAVFGAHAMSIVADTSRGRDAIEDWPLGGFVPRGNPLYLPISVAVGTLPGLLVFLFYYFSNERVSIGGPLILLISALLFTPLVWLPMLLEKSLQGPLHSQTFRQSFRHSGDGWILFYIETALLCFLAATGMSLWVYGSVILAPLSALLLVTPLILYFRLVGRLLWYIDPEMAPPPPREKDASTPLPETVDPTQLRR